MQTCNHIFFRRLITGEKKTFLSLKCFKLLIRNQNKVQGEVYLNFKF